ncbi:MAG: hypothetical protein HGA85_04765 [Nanoarchaeota archaeon]|nr:hypothetical protein [Nanoarchaeota archaeon]
MQSSTGIIHIEGLLGHGEDISEGITGFSRESIVQIQNVRIDHIKARDQVGFTDNHPDLVQSWGNAKEIRIDRFTGSSDYQGFMLKADDGYPHGPVIIKNANLIGDPTARYQFWIGHEDQGDITLENFWIDVPTERWGGLGNSVWPASSASAPFKSIVSKDEQGREYATFPAEMTPHVTGRITEGIPPEGDFVPPGVAGISYVSPGYLCTGIQCPAACTDECQTNGLKECSGNGYRTCGNYDSDTCFEWSSVTACAAGQTCASGACITQSTVLPGLSWEAEAGTITTPYVTAQGAIYQINDVSTPSNGGKASYLFNVDKPGGYIVKLILNASGEDKNSLYINIDSEPTEPYNVWDIPLTTGFEERIAGWRGSGTYNSNEFVPKSFNLEAGQHELIIRGREKYTMLDKITIEKYLPLLGDVNSDGEVDLNDIKEIVKEFGKTSGFTNKNSDVNKDNIINLKDIILVAKNIGR